MSKHHYDGADICMSCDRCMDEDCCSGANEEECDGQNWAFLTNGKIEEYAKEIMKKRGL